MNAKQFNDIVEVRIARCRATMLAKDKEYSRGGDRLHNFKSAARMDNTTPEQALWGMLKKHIVSVQDMIADTASGIATSRLQVDDKITDVINYALLLEGLFEERRATVANNASVADPDTRANDDSPLRVAPGGIVDDYSRLSFQEARFTRQSCRPGSDDPSSDRS